MEYVIVFVVAVLIGSGITFFIMRNNPDLEKEIRERIEKEYKAKVAEAQVEIAKLKEKLNLK